MVKTCRIVVASERDGAGIDWEGAWDNGNLGGVRLYGYKHLSKLMKYYS